MLIEVLRAAGSDRPVLENLLELYSHDFSEIVDLRLNSEGRFGYEYLPLYWTEEGRFPFLIKAGGELAGFALVRRGSMLSNDPEVWDMAEFFVVRGHRRRGVGKTAAQRVWDIFPGRWEVRVTEGNWAARSFWARVIASYSGAPVEPATDASGQWTIFSFDTPAKQ
jgi:predicted acetyltransferase